MYKHLKGKCRHPSYIFVVIYFGGEKICAQCCSVAGCDQGFWKIAENKREETSALTESISQWSNTAGKKKS